MAQHIRLAALAFFLILINSCGPDTIFLRPALDTPEQHVKNGNNLLDRGKIDAAYTEFARAKNLNAGYFPAYVGLAMVQGCRGNIDAGLDILKQAEAQAVTPEEKEAVDKGYERLKKMQ